MVADLLSALYTGKVSIDFTHWKTGEPLNVIGTLISETRVQQDPQTMTMIVFDTNADAWTDIRVSTITNWKVL